MYTEPRRDSQPMMKGEFEIEVQRAEAKQYRQRIQELLAAPVEGVGGVSKKKTKASKKETKETKKETEESPTTKASPKSPARRLSLLRRSSTLSPTKIRNNDEGGSTMSLQQQIELSLQ